MDMTDMAGEHPLDDGAQPIATAARRALVRQMRRAAMMAHEQAQPDLEHQPSTPRPVDPDALQVLLGKAIADLGATFSAGLVVVGERLGLYRALAAGGPSTSEELAERTDTNARLVREWLANQAAGGYVTYHPATERFSLSPEQALLLAGDGGPFDLPGAVGFALSAVHDPQPVTEVFQGVGELGWDALGADLCSFMDRFFQGGYRTNLIGQWIPALDGVEAKLRAGAKVADIGCGYGVSTILMGQAYPASTFVGSDFLEESVVEARRRAGAAGVTDRVTFEVAPATAHPGGGYDLVTIFNALHDTGDPVAVASHLHSTVAPDGTLMVVEPRAGDRLEDNLTPLARLSYAASTLMCVPAALAQGSDDPLGAQAGDARLTGVLQAAGFTSVRRAAETPFAVVLEAKP